MSRNNDVFQVLVPTGDQAILAKDLPVSSLAVGQFGVFSYKDNVSLDSTSADLATRGKNIYLAVGVDTTGGSTLNDLNKSSGTHLQVRNTVGYSMSCYTPGQDKIVELTDYTAQCNTEYGIKFEIRNQQAYRTNGYNQVMKSFVTTTDACTGCESCPTGNCASLAKNLVADINNDEDGIILAEAFSNVGSFTISAEATADGTATITLGTEAAVNVALLDLDVFADIATKTAAAINAVTGSAYTATASGAIVTVYGGEVGDSFVWAAGTATTSDIGTIVAIAITTITDLDAFALAAPGVCPELRFTMQPDAIKTFCDINLNYFSARQTDVIVTKIAGFEAVGTLTTTQDIIYESGSGYDVKQLEYEAGGWNARPGTYRVSNLNGVARNGFNYFSTASGKYNMINVAYDQASIAGFQEHRNANRTIIAVPTADTTARDGIVAVLDAILASYEPLAAFATACPSDGTTINTTIDSGESFGESIGTN
jgi:hypothetical protein